MIQNSPIDYFPRQRVSSGNKNQEWFRKCIDAGIASTLYSTLSDSKRTHSEELVLKNLSEGILDMNDIEKTINQSNIHDMTAHKQLQNYPLAKPRIDLLIGESIRRRFDWAVRVVNDDSISEKEKELKAIITQRMVEMASAGEVDEQRLQQKLNDLTRWVRYEYQDLRERMASQILNHLYESEKLSIKFMNGMDDALNIGKEVYCVDIVNNEPTLRRIDPLNIHTLRSGSSMYIEDSDIIVEDSYRPLGYIIDTYHEWLKPSEIDKLERGTGTDKAAGSGKVGISHTYPVFPSDMFGDTSSNSDVLDFFSTVPANADYGAYDPYGNVRETKVVWKGMRKIGIVKFYDEEGMLDSKIVDENWKANAELGEKVKWVWVTEWYEGTRLADGIYVKMQPRPIQFRKMDALGAGGSGYAGTIYPQSLLEIMKPYQYLYIIIMEEIKKALKKFKGPRMELDLAKIPDDWKLEDWMYYAEEMGYLITDSFKEGNKGAAQGKLVGNMQTPAAKEFNSEMGSYINQLVIILQFIERQVAIISGVSDQRLGQIENRETVGGIERSVTQSSHITEKMFALHDYTKVRAMELLLNTAKFAWSRKRSKKMQFVLDDMSTQILNINGEQFNESEYGIFVSNSSNDTQLMDSMKQLAHAMIQNDRMNIKDLMTVLTAPSIGTMRRELERSEDERMQREQQQFEQQQQIQEQQIQANMQAAQAQLDLENLMNIRDNETKLAIGLKDDESNRDSIDNQKLSLEKEKLAIQKRKQDKELSLKEKDLQEKKRHNMATETISKKSKVKTN